MKVLIEGVLLDTVTKEYEFEGKKGVTYQLVIYSHGTLEKVKVTKEIYDDYSLYVNTNISLECSLFVKGQYSLSFKG